MDKMPAALYVIDDEPTIHRCAAEFAASLGIRCGVFSSAEQFLDSVNLSLPGCVVSESRLGGLELQTRLAGLGSILSVVMVGANLDVPTVVRAMQTGAIAVFEKPCDAVLLTNAIHTAIDLSLAKQEARRTRSIQQLRFETLDPRERRVMAMIVNGIPTKSIARELGVCQRTAARIRADVFEKMGVESAVKLSQVAVKLDGLPGGPRAGEIRVLSGRHTKLPAVHSGRHIQAGIQAGDCPGFLGHLGPDIVGENGTIPYGAAQMGAAARQ